LTHEGANIAVADLKEPPEGVPCQYLAVDLSETTRVERLIAEAWEALGCLDILVNNAGIWPTVWFTEMETAHRQRTLDVNLTA
jgi:NAD(P)-dependent dehydrogenase (short-subunit alcohol dehydrogenase family)